MTDKEKFVLKAKELLERTPKINFGESEIDKLKRENERLVKAVKELADKVSEV